MISPNNLLAGVFIAGIQQLLHREDKGLIQRGGYVCLYFSGLRMTALPESDNN